MILKLYDSTPPKMFAILTYLTVRTTAEIISVRRHARNNISIVEKPDGIQKSDVICSFQMNKKIERLMNGNHYLNISDRKLMNGIVGEGIKIYRLPGYNSSKIYALGTSYQEHIEAKMISNNKWYLIFKAYNARYEAGGHLFKEFCFLVVFVIILGILKEIISDFEDEDSKLLKDPASCSNFAIRHASGRGRVELVKKLLADPRCDPAVDDNCPLRWAAENGHVEVVKILLADPRIQPSACKNYALRFALLNQHQDIVKLLLQDSRTNLSVNTNEILVNAVYRNNLEFLKTVINKGFMPSITVLEKAAYYGKTDMVKFLVNNVRMTPTLEVLKSAAMNGDTESVRFLLKYVNPEDGEALRYAIENKRDDVINILLRDGRIDLDRTVSNAILHDQKKAVEFLENNRKNNELSELVKDIKEIKEMIKSQVFVTTS